MSIIMVSMVNFRVAIVPMLDEQREAHHMGQVGDALAAIKGEADRQVDNGGRPPVTTSVPLKPQEPAGFLTGGALASYLSFKPDIAPVRLNATELRIQVDNGTAVFGPDETWTDITVNDALNNITGVQHLRIRVEAPHNEDEGDYVELVLKDKDDVYAGDLRVYVTQHPSGYSVNVRVRDADLDVLYDQGDSYFNQDQPPFYWVDALADEVQFADVLQATEGPYNLTIVESGMQGAFTVVYHEETESGVILVGSAGKLYTDWERIETGGRLTYLSQNLRFIRQDLYMEGGAIVLNQTVGNTFHMEPALTVEVTGTKTFVWITVPTLTGREVTHSGRDAVPVRLQGREYHAVSGTAPDVLFNVTTDHPLMWTNFWKMKFNTAGLSSAAGEYVVSSGNDWAQFIIYGNTPTPGSTVHDLTVDIQTGQVDVTMRG